MSRARRDRENAGGAGPPGWWPPPPSSSFVPGAPARQGRDPNRVYAVTIVEFSDFQ